MFHTGFCATAIGTMLVGAAALFPSAAAAGGGVGWSVAFVGPGFAVTAGEPGYMGAPRRPYDRPHFRPVVVPPPVAIRTWFAPVPVAVRYPAYVPRPVVFAPAPVVVGPRPLVVAPPPYAMAGTGDRY